MNVERFTELIGADYYTGVPDSQLKPLSDYLLEKYSIDPKHHVIAANEGNCMGLAAGYYMATKNIPVVYMQNSGEGNAINPLLSLLSPDCYAIPCILIIGWRGEPGVHDEPQHIHQGKVTIKILDLLGIDHYVITKETQEEDILKAMDGFKKCFEKGKSVAFVVKKGSLSYEKKNTELQIHGLKRETVIEHICKYSGEDIIVSTTGKTSRELYEIRDAKSMSHKYDFLTVGSMGHASSIALNIAVNKPGKKVWCIDGDGAALMHLGSFALTGSVKPSNLVHIVINNGAHDTVGGQPTVAKNIDFPLIAEACGYQNVYTASTEEEIDSALSKVSNADQLSFLEIKCTKGARDDLGRPKTTAKENKDMFMCYINE